MLRRRSEKLVVLDSEGLVVYEERAAAKQVFRFDEILVLEHEKMLSAFWLRLVCRDTASELMLFQESDPIRTVTYNQYAVKAVFIPYRSIRQVQTTEDAMMRQLRLRLQGTRTLSLAFDAENEAFPGLCQALARMTPTASDV
jgi:hypothetical protein